MISPFLGIAGSGTLYYRGKTAKAEAGFSVKGNQNIHRVMQFDFGCVNRCDQVQRRPASGFELRELICWPQQRLLGPSGALRIR